VKHRIFSSTKCSQIAHLFAHFLHASLRQAHRGEGSKQIYNKKATVYIDHIMQMCSWTFKFRLGFRKFQKNFRPLQRLNLREKLLIFVVVFFVLIIHHKQNKERNGSFVIFLYGLCRNMLLFSPIFVLLLFWIYH
jgi:hypothetical protein